MSDLLFKRDYKLIIGDVDVSGLGIEFKVKKTLAAKPNTCEVKVYGLNESTRKHIESKETQVVQLDAGYKNALSTIYLGETRRAWSEKQPTTFVTTVTTGDSEKKMAKTRINIPVGKGVPVEHVFEQIANALGVKPGNLSKAVSDLQKKGLSSYFGEGSIISGNVSKEITRLCKSVGLEWSVQDGKLQFLDLGRPTDEKAVLLSSDTGMIKAPKIDNKGVLEVTALLIPELVPGRKISLKSLAIQGGFRIVEVEYSGASDGGEWYAKMKCDKY